MQRDASTDAVSCWLEIQEHLSGILSVLTRIFCRNIHPKSIFRRAKNYSTVVGRLSRRLSHEKCDKKCFLPLGTGAKNSLYFSTGFRAAYRLLADSPRTAHPVPTSRMSACYAAYSSGSSTAGQQLCLLDSAKYSSRTA